MPVVILGSGIIGLSTAYFLSLPPNHLNPTTPSTTTTSTSNPPSTADWQPPEIHLVDPSPTLFRATASGLAGGFLAKDWFAPTVAPLGALSFDLHRRLAEACGGKEKWGWCETEGWNLDRDKGEEGEGEGEVGKGREDMDLSWLMSGSSRATLLAAAGAEGSSQEEAGTHPKWIRAPASAFKSITDRSSTAQVDPMRLCEFLLSECLARGVKLHSPARATELVRDATSGATSVRIEYLDTTTMPTSSDIPSTFTPTRTLDIPCTSLILSSGAWTPHVFNTLFPTAPRIPRINPLAGYSLLVKSPYWQPISSASASEDTNTRVCHAVFTSDSGAGAGFSPEVFSRAGGEIWFGGLNKKGMALPDTPTPLVLPVPGDGEEMSPRMLEDEKAIETLKDLARTLCRVPSTPSSTSTPSAQIEFTRTSLCFRPVSPTGKPYIGRIDPADLGLPADSYSDAQLQVFMGTAHGPWGISLSLGTGWVLGEMVRGEETSVDVGPLAKWQGVASGKA
ncbi:hypothetical protein EIP91_008334 [Steccherinum ochraceum]|uniref:FAD dependent oxidoreductase domain-containing protein n=1 Tax=Steccherinum ochraceum TaxID=92696 RepID=A0A4R0RL33_9APHY|nr:hypothetical protein EIP91_008334 [Steccherinum ochraceum]